MSRGLYWILAVCLLIFGISLPILIHATISWTTGNILGACMIELVMLGLLLGLYDPFRFVNWLRLVAGVIVLTYLVYVIDMLTSASGPLIGTSRSQPSLVNALAGLVVWGLPAFIFMIKGKRWFSESEEELLDMILFASTNPHKIDEVAAIMEEAEVFMIGLDELGEIPPEPVEDADTFEGNARLKAIGYAQSTGRVCLADDSGLAVDALDGAPGVYSARYAGIGDTRDERDAANNAKLLAALEDVPDEQRTARFVCAMCLAAPDGSILAETRGEFPGVIAREPRGTNGFGYDPLLYLPDVDCTSAQLTPEVKNARSHRGEATRKMAAAMQDLEIEI